MSELGLWWDRLAQAFGHPAFHAVVVALLVGIALTEAMSHLLPMAWSADAADRAMRLGGGVVVILVGYWLHPTTIGAGWSLFAGLAAPSIHHHLRAWLYYRWPALTPKVLQ